MRRASVFLVLVCAWLPAQSPKDVRRVARQGQPALPELRRFLLNPDIKVREEATKSIIDIGGPRSLDPLIDATRDNDPDVQTLAIKGLVNFYAPGYIRTGLTAPLRSFGADIRSRFYDPDDQVIDRYIVVRADVIQAIGKVASGGTSLDARAVAARALGILRGKQALPDLENSLRSHDSDVLLEALVAIEKIRDRSACSSIHFLLRDLNEKVQIEAIEANGVLACQVALPDLRDIVQRTDKDRVRRAALSAIAMLPEPRDRDLFNRFLGSDDEKLRVAAAEGFARLASIEDAQRMQTAYDAETRNAPRLALAFALVMEGNLAMTEFAPLRYLTYSLNSKSFQNTAAAYLSEAARNPEVRRALYGALNDGTRDEKIQLAAVLSASGDRATVPELDKLTHDADPVVAQEGVRQLRNLRARL